MQPKISLGLATTPFKAQTLMFSSRGKTRFGYCLFFFSRAHYDIINAALHLSRTTSHLTNVGRKVSQWSIGQSTRDLCGRMWSVVFYPWSSFALCIKGSHLQATYCKQPTYITKWQIMDTTVCPTTELFLWKLIIGCLAVTAERATCQ